MGFAEIIIQEATIIHSEKNVLASRIFRLFKVAKYLQVTKKFATLMIEAVIASNTPIKPMSIRPIAVKRVRAEKGVIIAHPGSKSLAFLSIDQKTPSSLTYLL